MTIRLATDIGGTFTDLVAFDERSGQMTLGKSSSTPADFAQGVLDAIRISGVDLAAVHDFVHGCTVVINAITERSGVKTALVTTAGFRDVLEIGRGNRPDMYNLRFQKPRPFVPRELRFEVRERIDRFGAVLTPLQEEDIAAIVSRCQAAEVKAVAVCLLHAYAHPAHERRLAALLRAGLPDVALTISSDITQEWREYERTSTAVLNGYVMPIVEQYLTRLEAATADQAMVAPCHVMQSNGGTATFAMAKRLPINLIESGPVAGVIGAAAVGKALSEPNIISFDVGGTTAKCSLIEEYEPRTTTEYRLEWTPLFPGYPVKTPVVDIVEVGAGGGSIAWFDDGGALHVGPKSAGADPGPACYGRGGVQPTVTDAKLVAGVLSPASFLGGDLTIYPERARAALEPLAKRLGAGVEETANGIIRMVNASMTEALKLISVQKGHDPRDFALIAFGGGGAMHAAALAKEMHIKKVIVPPHPGHFSAWGMLMTLPRIDLVRTSVRRVGEISAAELTVGFEALAQEIAQRFAEDQSGNFDAGNLRFQRRADLRYHGQEHTVSVSVPDDVNGEVDLDETVRRFHQGHERLYTFQLAETPVEFVNYHVTGFRPIPTPDIAGPAPGSGRKSPTSQLREVDFDEDGRHMTAVYQREELPVGFTTIGPAIVEETASTTLVHPGQELEVDALGNLVIHI